MHSACAVHPKHCNLCSRYLPFPIIGSSTPANWKPCPGSSQQTPSRLDSRDQEHDARARYRRLLSRWSSPLQLAEPVFLSSASHFNFVPFTYFISRGCYFESSPPRLKGRAEGRRRRLGDMFTIGVKLKGASSILKESALKTMFCYDRAVTFISSCRWVRDFGLVEGWEFI